MGKAAKFYKRPTLKEKQSVQRGFASSSAASRGEAEAQSDDETYRQPKKTVGQANGKGKAMQSLEEPDKVERLRALKAEAASLRSQIKSTTHGTKPDRAVVTQTNDAEEAEERDKPKRRKRLSHRKRAKVAPGEPRTPKEAGVDYLRQWEGKKQL